VTLVGHSCSLKGVASYVASYIGFVPGVGAVVLSNLSGFAASKVLLGTISLMLGLPVENPSTKVRDYQMLRTRLEQVAGGV